MLLHGLEDDDKKLYIQILRNVEIKFSRLWPEQKSKQFPEVYSSVVKSKAPQQVGRFIPSAKTSPD
jgi:hypothetical protein